MNNSNSLPEWDKHLSTKPRMNIGIAVLLTLITCGIYGLVWQYKQMKILNFWLNKREYTFGMWFFTDHYHVRHLWDIQRVQNGTEHCRDSRTE